MATTAMLWTAVQGWAGDGVIAIGVMGLLGHSVSFWAKVLDKSVL